MKDDSWLFEIEIQRCVVLRFNSPLQLKAYYQALSEVGRVVAHKALLSEITSMMGTVREHQILTPYYYLRHGVVSTNLTTDSIARLELADWNPHVEEYLSMPLGLLPEVCLLHDPLTTKT
jgi:hypothetical protein